MTTKIDFIDLKTQYKALKEEIDTRIQNVLNHGQYILGPEITEIETKLAEYSGSKHCITCASGTEALLISLMALGIGPGDEVITTPFTFVATAEVIVLVGATPVFVDIQPDTYNIDPQAVEAAISSKTKALIPVSLYGQTADMDELNKIAEKHHIAIIEDGCQSFGADYKGKKSCNLSTIGCTSFFPSKPLGCYGDGGACFTNDDQLAKLIKEIRVHGQSARYYHTEIGVGGRMDSIQGAILLAKLTRFDWELEQREIIASRYRNLLAPLGNKIKLQQRANDRTSVYAQYTIHVQNRDEVCKKINDAGIPTAIHYPICLHQQPAYKEICRISGSLTHAEEAAAGVFSIPMHPNLDETTQKRITDAIIAAIQ